MLKYLIASAAFFLLNVTAKANFEFNANCINAYEKIMQLRLNEARTIIATEKRLNPTNSITVLLDNYVDYYVLLTTESRADFDRMKANKSVRLDRLSKEDKKSPYYLYSQAEINLQWAMMRSRYQEYFAAGMEINRALSMLEQNAKKFSGFLPNQKCLGLVNVLLGSLPDGLKKTLGTFGIKGNAATGIEMLNRLVKILPESEYSQYYDEVVFYLSYIETDILNNTHVYNDIILNTNRIDTLSLLRSYIRGYAGMKTAHNDQAIAILKSRPSGSPYQPFPYLQYLIGIAYMHKLDNAASAYLTAYLKEYKGINYIKDAYLNLAWISLINGDTEQYKSYIEQVKAKGYTYHDKDKQAVKEARDMMPNVDLLKARLLFDGGYYKKALDILDNKKADSFGLKRDKIEYCYRLGRIYDEIGRDEIAVKFYQFAIDLGRNEHYYYAANSALHIAGIYEQKQNTGQATSFYNLAISMKNHDYENSIESKAKQGLKRIGKD